MEKNFPRIQASRLPTLRNRVPGEVDQLRRPSHQQTRLVSRRTTPTLSNPQPIRHSLVSSPASHWTVTPLPFSTQNKIKNRFYGTLRNLVRLLLNHFDGGHSAYNTEITKLSPKFLNDMYCSQNSNQSFTQTSPSSRARSSRASRQWVTECRKR